MGTIKNNEFYNKLSNEAQSNFGKIHPVGKFLTNNARIMVEVLDDETMRITYRSLIHFSTKLMLPVITEVEYGLAKTAVEEIVERISKKVGATITLREEDLLQEYAEFIANATEEHHKQCYYRWSVIADVKAPKQK